jgi:drug/metabolite transporter (DMT)-like permease
MTEMTAPAVARRDGGFAPLDYGLYGVVVLLWGTSWIALHLQLGVVAPEVSVTWRFLIATVIMLGFALASGARMRYAAADHGRFAVLGLTLFSSNFLFFYYGGLSTPSGLLAVVFSLVSVFNMVLASLMTATRPSPRLVLAAIMGSLGVAAMFGPQLVAAEFGPAALHGLLFCVAGTLSFCIGNILSIGTRQRGVPITASTAWGMAYGTAFLALFALMRGQTFTVEWTLPYLGSLVWLAVMSSVLAFAAYLRLLDRIGPARAGYSSVLYPVVALAVSTVFEGYRWGALPILGLALVVGGNLVMLRRGEE